MDFTKSEFPLETLIEKCEISTLITWNSIQWPYIYVINKDQIQLEMIKQSVQKIKWSNKK